MGTIINSASLWAASILLAPARNRATKHTSSVTTIVLKIIHYHLIAVGGDLPIPVAATDTFTESKTPAIIQVSFLQPV